MGALPHPPMVGGMATGRVQIRTVTTQISHSVVCATGARHHGQVEGEVEVEVEVEAMVGGAEAGGEGMAGAEGRCSRRMTGLVPCV